VNTIGPLDRAREATGLQSVADMVRRHWLMVVGIVAACVVVGVVHYKTATKSYSATASVAFQTGTLTESALQIASAGSAEPQRQADTEMLIAHSPEVASRAAKVLRISDSPGSLLGLVKVEAVPNADVLNVTAAASSPAFSAALANAFADQYIAFRAASQLAGIEKAENAIQAQIAALPVGSSERPALQQALQRLMELRAVAGSGANIIGRATPPSEPAGMRLSTTALISVVIGLAIAFALLFLVEMLDRRLKSIEEIEFEYRLPALVAIPNSPGMSEKAQERRGALEPYRILRSALDLAAVTKPLNTLLVTSAVTGEGKTTVAVDLGHAIALTGRDVVLVELDLRRPSFATHMDLDGKRGVTTALTGGDVSRLLVRPLSDLSNFSVLPAGGIPPNPSELLGSEQIREILSDLAAVHDMVIVDSPPLNPVADSQVLLDNPAIHGVLIVARADLTTRTEARRARAILDFHMVDPVGVVVTGLRNAGSYGYQLYGADESATTRALTPKATGTESPRRRRRVAKSSVRN
jgi:succinoglycan biosynthesis transport protein ExoP